MYIYRYLKLQNIKDKFTMNYYMTAITDRDKKKIIEDAKKLNKIEQIQLLKIIIDNNVSYTENNNGCLINLSKIPDNVILELKNIIDICNERYKEELKRKKFYEEAKINVEKHYQNKIKKNININKSKKKSKKTEVPKENLPQDEQDDIIENDYNETEEDEEEEIE